MFASGFPGGADGCLKNDIFDCGIQNSATLKREWQFHPSRHLAPRSRYPDFLEVARQNVLAQYTAIKDTGIDSDSDISAITKTRTVFLRNKICISSRSHIDREHTHQPGSASL